MATNHDKSFEYRTEWEEAGLKAITENRQVIVVGAGIGGLSAAHWLRQRFLENGRVVGVQMEGDGSVRRAGHVIVAVTPPAAARLLPEELDEQRP